MCDVFFSNHINCVVIFDCFNLFSLLGNFLYLYSNHSLIDKISHITHIDLIVLPSPFTFFIKSFITGVKEVQTTFNMWCLGSWSYSEFVVFTQRFV